ncbi:hypothetical protein HU200_037988 [Digitaria exilis]|uniref:Uncharacterized protein n=1 Tax=Digitaria exilis TaxID=1010633 RepID=A0A835BPS8_9POAL|nr:hypothetical protein HU200_037988 [Digitaria exilis]
MELTGIKLPRLCPRTCTVDLLDDSFCRTEERGTILCGMWSLWNSRNDRRRCKNRIEPRPAIEWGVDCCVQLLSDSKSHTNEMTAQPTELWRRPPPRFGQSKHGWSFRSRRFHRGHRCSDSDLLSQRHCVV